MSEKFIPKAECRDRKLYRIDSRNLRFGVYREKSGGFLGLRQKFGNVYVFEEFHWDNGEPYGTVCPQEELPEELPAEIVNAEDLGDVCQTCGKACAYIKWPDGEEQEITLKDGSKMFVPGMWQHLEETSCTDLRARIKSNQPLFEWLSAMEQKYR